MNECRRHTIERIEALLFEISSLLEDTAAKCEAYDNMPESIHKLMLGERRKEIACSLQKATKTIHFLKSRLNNVRG